MLGVIPAKKNRQRLALREMSSWLPKATVAIEDRRFWQHGALDYVGIVRAAVADLKAGRSVQGGSTLTQQLARNLYIGEPKDTISRKIQEACLAMKIGDRWSKQKILAAYLNLVYYGNQAYGVEAASQTYFSKPASKLSVWQAALLAGLPQAPSVYDPLRNPHAARARRNEVLLAMRDAGYLKPAAWSWARQQPVRLHPGSLYKTIHEPYFFSYVTDQLVSRFGPKIVESGGLRVKTTIDPRLQSLATGAIRGLLLQRTDPSAALVAIDPRNGKVRAMSVVVPSGERLQFNLAVQGHRQAGSSFKPFTLAAVLEHGMSLATGFNGPPQMTITDPRCSTNNQPWDVHNNADETAGYMNLIDATANSVNTIFAQLVTQVGPPAVVRMAHRLGIRSNLLPVCSITLGTQAVSPLEMTSAYATLAARGVRHDPQAVEWVRTADGRTLTFEQTKPARALDQDVADRVTYALEAVTQRGTATGANFGRPIAGKTGTAEKFVDAWFCGYTPQLATCVWIGYPHRELEMNSVEGYSPVYGGGLPASIWRTFMSGALEHAPVLSFPVPQDVYRGSTYHSSSGYSTYSSGYSSSSSSTPTTSTTTPAPAPAPAPATTTAPVPPPPPPGHGNGHGRGHSG
ncbi:MAG TPA: transglycosylase domain-containing protein [Gaiellaceae bacterium]|nr:transglycosylase domain-containing protein [Gaiellaceae bacterium]